MCEQVVCEKVCVCVSCVEMVEDRLCERGTDSCVRESCGGQLCVRELCVRELCLREGCV